MIINEALRATAATLNSLNWIDQYGGVAIPLRRDEGGTEVNGKHVPLYRTYPVSEDLTAEECWGKQHYRRLIPNAQYRNLLYWEVTTPAKPIAHRQTPPKGYTVQGAARLVYWLNLPALGIGREEGYQLGSVGLALAHRLAAPYLVRRGVKLVLEDPTFEQTDAARIFPYDYDFNQALLLYPYGFGAVSFTCTVHVRPDCLPALNFGPPISCP